MNNITNLLSRANDTAAALEAAKQKRQQLDTLKLPSGCFVSQCELNAVERLEREFEQILLEIGKSTWEATQ